MSHSLRKSQHILRPDSRKLDKQMERLERNTFDGSYYEKREGCNPPTASEMQKEELRALRSSSFIEAKVAAHYLLRQRWGIAQHGARHPSGSADCLGGLISRRRFSLRGVSTQPIIDLADLPSTTQARTRRAIGRLQPIGDALYSTAASLFCHVTPCEATPR